MLKRDDLREYQSSIVEFIKVKKRCGLFLNMGLGKTATTLTAICDLLEQGKVNRVLIIAPVKVTNLVWKQELDNWEHLQNLNIEICTGNEQKRLNILSNNSSITIISHNSLSWLISTVDWQWDMIVIDESSVFKNHSSKKFKALRKVLKFTTHIILLSGTPMPNGIMGLWSQLYLLDGGKRLGRSITSYRETYFKQVGRGVYFNYEPLNTSLDIISNKIKDICITTTPNYKLISVDITYTDIIKSLPPNLKSKYLSFNRSNVLELHNGAVNIIANSAGAKCIKQLQFCNGVIYDELGSEHYLHDIKLQALGDIINNNKGKNILVAYNFKSDLNQLLKRFKRAAVLSDKGDTLKDWNAGKVKLMLAHPASVAFGINAQFGGAIIVWYGLTWWYELYSQFNSRLYRSGQVHPVQIYHIIIKGCIDERVIYALKNKCDYQLHLLNSINKQFN